MGFQLVSKCQCCLQPQKETISHVFVSGDLAKGVWSKFEEFLHIHSRTRNLQNKLVDWWLVKANSPCIKDIMSFIPMAICWELWKARNQIR